MARTIAAEIDNFLAIVHDLAVGAEEWSSRPAWLEFAPNNVCNLRCIMCGQADGLPLEVMDKEAAVRVLDQVLPHASLLTPSALSEPMLANMKLMVEKCREHGVYLNFHTNATIMDGEKLEEIADRIHQLFISFDSPDKETFETLRARADFDTVVKHIREILPVAAKHNVPVGFVAVYMRHNAEHMADLVDFLADLGAAEHHCDLRVQPMLDNARSLEDAEPLDHYTEEQICAFLDAAADRARARGLNFHVEMKEPYSRNVTVKPLRIRGVLPDILTQVADNARRRYPGFCSMASYYMKIEPNGDVFPCCRGPRELKMGNTNEQSVEEIWNGEKYRAFRRRMHARDYPEVCKTCDILVANPAFREMQARGGVPDTVSTRTES